jgi:hypothetical protein
LARELAAFQIGETCRVTIIPTEVALPGDIRITWANGAAERNATSLWDQIANALSCVGLQPQTINPEIQQHAA